MKKIFFAIFAMTTLLLSSCSNDDITITTTPKIRTLTYVVNTQSMYDELGITSETVSNYLSKGYSVGVYTFVYDSDGKLVTTQSSRASSLGTATETFQFEEGAYTIKTYETLVGNGSTPSWSGEDKLSTLTFNDNSSSDYHYISGACEKEILIAGDKTETVSPAATKVLLTYNVNTQSIYDEFGVSKDITNNFLRDKEAAIGLFTYIYNSNGDLVDSVATQQFTMNTASQIRSLAKGNYTIVTVETLVDTDNNNQSESWNIKDTENLSTIKISQESHSLSYPDIVGVCTISTSINGNNSLSATPKAIGSMVRFHTYNIENSPFVNVGFGTSDILDYYSINPQLARNEKFSENLSLSDYFNLRGHLSAEKIIEGYYNFLYIVESSIVPNYAAQDEKNAGTSRWSIWEADNENLEDGKIYDAGFYYLTSDDTHYYARNYFGNETGLASWKKECDDYIKGIDKLYQEPYLTWGGTVNAVKSFMSGYNVGNNGNLTEHNGNYVLWYYGKNKEEEIDYYFTSSTGGLTDAYVFFDSEKVGEDDLSKAFTEMGYEFVLSDEDYTAYVTKDMKSLVMVFLYAQKNWVVNYFSASSSSSALRQPMKKDFSKFAPKKQHSGLSSMNIGKVSVVNSLRQCENMMKLYSK